MLFSDRYCLNFILVLSLQRSNLDLWIEAFTSWAKWDTEELSYRCSIQVSYCNAIQVSYCNSTQNPKHLVFHCHHFTEERAQLVIDMKPQITTLKTLFEIKKKEKISPNSRSTPKSPQDDGFRDISKKKRKMKRQLCEIKWLKSQNT